MCSTLMRYIGAIKACESQFLQMVIALGWIRVEKKIVVLPELPQTLLGRLLLLLPPPLLICYSSSSSHPKGASIHDVRKMFGFNPPPSPITFINQLILFLLSAFWSPHCGRHIWKSPKLNFAIAYEIKSCLLSSFCESWRKRIPSRLQSMSCSSHYPS